MLPHPSSRDRTRTRRARRDDRPLDLAWLEERAMRYAARQETSAASVAALLERKVGERCERTGESAGPVLEMIPRLVARLIARGYVDDRRFASQLIRRQRRAGASAAAIRARLAARGIDGTLVGSLLSEEEPESEIRSAWKLARRRRLGPYCEDPTERGSARERHLGVLARHGYDLDVALQIVEAESAPESS